jgi:hypothetical protein
LGSRMEPLYHPIQFKLGNVLQVGSWGVHSSFLVLDKWKLLGAMCKMVDETLCVYKVGSVELVFHSTHSLLYCYFVHHLF